MPKKPCTHDNVTITETAREHISHVFADGKYAFSDHLTIRVECPGCGLSKAYSKYHMPKWLERKWQEVTEK